MVTSIFLAIASAFASDQKQYHVVLITHSAHKVCMITFSKFGVPLWIFFSGANAYCPWSVADEIDLLIILQNLTAHLAGKNVAYFPISSPPVLSIHENHDTEGFDC
ncbi:hypothetical protein CK203_045409 [Vitis vinifera]|uniref:Uncharacterized protein n=1 Tax=Vitis vinifera TaxID=29760 RepID=A0A438H9H2_VITVI|nr:hypothetical protein CK203_045409 [Vitis vinifera]